MKSDSEPEAEEESPSLLVVEGGRGVGKSVVLAHLAGRASPPVFFHSSGSGGSDASSAEWLLRRLLGWVSGEKVESGLSQAELSTRVREGLETKESGFGGTGWSG